MVNNAIKNVFKAAGAEALVTTQGDLRFYLTGFQSTFGVVVADKDGVTFYTDSRYLEAAQKSLENSGVTVAE